MIVTCEHCGARFEDVYRWTFCPHDTFLAADGQNNFYHHPEAFLSAPNVMLCGKSPPAQKCQE